MKKAFTLVAALGVLLAVCIGLTHNGSGGYGGKYAYAGLPRTSPAYTNVLLVLTNAGCVVAYDEQKKNPAWTCYHLFKVDSLIAPPRPEAFDVDARTRARVASANYDDSGYDRGHQAPNYAIGVCYGTNAQSQTFLMSNVIPQKPKLNREVWERLESTEIKDWAQRYTNIWVVTGPVYSEHPDKMTNGILVPDKCFKIIVREDAGQPKALAFEIPQTVAGTESPTQFLTTVTIIEKDTGLMFFNDLPGEMRSKLENEKAAGTW